MVLWVVRKVKLVVDGLWMIAGGVGSPRHFGALSKEPNMLPSSHQHPGTATHNPHSITNSQRFPNAQHPAMMYHGPAALNTANLATNQYCYDRTTVPLYQPGPGEVQDPRPALPLNNPTSHQLGGKPLSR